MLPVRLEWVGPLFPQYHRLGVKSRVIKSEFFPENFSACLTPKPANKLRIITTPRSI
jgi:hypothetical protein